MSVHVSMENEMIFSEPLSSTRKKWMITTSLLTFYISDCCLMKNRDVRQAFREKIAILTIIIIFSLSLLFIVAILPQILCPDITVYSWENIYKSKKQLMVVSGNVIDVDGFDKTHPGIISNFQNYLGQDITHIFESPHPSYKLPSTIKIYSELLYTYLDRQINDTEKYCSKNFCHPYLNETMNIIKSMYVGDLIYTYRELNEFDNANWFILYNIVYNISTYVEYGHGIYPSKYDRETIPRDMAYYLDSRLNTTIMNRLGRDASGLFDTTFIKNERLGIIEYLSRYKIGTLDTRYNNVCRVLDYTYLIFVCLIAGILVIKFLTSLCTLVKQYPKCDAQNLIIIVPCYTESEYAMQKTIYSIYDSEYPDDKKLIFVVADGMIKGKGNKKSTAEIALNIFGRSLNESCDELVYDSIGEKDKTFNRAKVYCGWHTNNNRRVPYIVIVKTGMIGEKDDPRKGNRGKRDSQLILYWWLNKVHFKQFDEMTDLEKSINNAVSNTIGIDPYSYKFMMTVDADTFLYDDAIIQMIFRMKDPRIIALCGETTISNRTESWITVIQVYEYYINHALNKGFESMFSTVTCLPGCFSMYRIRTDDDRRKPLFIKPELLDDYSDNNINTLHKKNLFDLGEDRYFTTLLNKYFPTWKIKFVSEARCETNVPSTWSVLLSQRRRWINSTIHNLLELMTLDRLCGCCCFSMKFIVLIDILTTISLPVMSGYFIYLIYLFSIGTPVPIVFMIIVCSVGAVQILIFVIKRDLWYIIWFIIYTLAFPIWTIILPTYAFLHMDDFSWGATHKVDKKTPKTKEIMIEMKPINVSEEESEEISRDIV